jgi:hypothetical protein
MGGAERTLNVRERAKRFALLLGAVLLVHALLVAWMAFHQSANANESAHLATGVYHLRYGRFDVYRVNPPLPRMIAAAPAAWLLGIEADWLPTASGALGHRPEFEVGSSIFRRRSNRGSNSGAGGLVVAASETIVD